MKLAIISHTEHYMDVNGNLKGWGPTVREINFLATKFEEIIHVACLHSGSPPDSCISYTSKNIIFIPITPSGGKSFLEKISVLTSAPLVIRKVISVLKKADVVQIRVPTGFANYLLPFLSLKDNRPLIWVKYAGNWNQQNSPLGYRFQRWWLKNNFLQCKVTINGSWPAQPKHCITFENPCLDESERTCGLKIITKKQYSGPYIACFIGRTETAKGVKRILDALPFLAEKNILTIHFIGEGNELNEFKLFSQNQTRVRCIFHRSMSRENISSFLEQSHFLLLPSTASEGFPKVIAEGANYGAIPIVSDISSIGQYINETNGYVWDHQTDFNNWIRNIDITEERLIAKSKHAYKMAEGFTFENYFHNLQLKILSDN